MRKYLYIWQKIIIFSSIDKIIQTSLNIIHDRVFTFKKRSFEQWNSPPGALYQIPQPGLTTEIKSPPNGRVLMDEQFSAVIHVKQTMKRSNAPILTMIRNLWAISGCHEIILNVMCDVKGSSDASHFIFKINVGKGRIRIMTLNLNLEPILSLSRNSEFNSRVV